METESLHIWGSAATIKKEVQVGSLEASSLQLQRPTIASPLLSERVRAAILLSLCAEEKKLHGKAVVACLERQQMVINIAEEEAVFSFADAIDIAHYDARGMIVDFFPRYPYKTTRKIWEYFKTWVTEGIGQLYKELCIEWIELAQLYLRKCSSCRACAHKPTPEMMLRVFGTYRPYFIGERPHYMYRDDDQMVLKLEIYPVAGGLVMDGAEPMVKNEVPDAPPGFAWPMTHFEIGGPSGDVRDSRGDPAKEEEAAEDQIGRDPMMLDSSVYVNPVNCQVLPSCREA